MADKTIGKLKRESKDGVPGWACRWQRSNGKWMDKFQTVKADAVAAELHGWQGEEELDVEMELISGQPRNIRRIKTASSNETSAEAPSVEKPGEAKPASFAAESNQTVATTQATATNLPQANVDAPESHYFHNPYNFVPAPPRKHIDGHANDLGDREPSGHDRFLANQFSGKLCVRMKVVTPLLLPDTARVEITESDNDYAKKDHKTFDVRVGEDGTPEINPTAIKGMLRSAYEAVTNSRLSIFKDHDERLAFRMESTEGARSIPARIERDETDGKLYIVLYTGTSKRGEDGTPKKDSTRADKRRYSTMYAAWVRKYHWHRNPLAKLSGNHSDKVWVYITRWEHRRFDFWNVVEIRPYSSTQPSGPQPVENRARELQKIDKKTGKPILKNGKPDRNIWWNVNNPPSPNPQGRWVEGYICTTNQNIGNKHDERIFFNASPRPEKILLEENHKKAWKALVENYRQEHDNGKGGLKEPPEGIRWSRHIKSWKNEIDLKEATLCYARGSENARGEFEVEELYPVTISRRLHVESPEKLLPIELHPAYKTRELSPADCVFGWVRQADKEKHKKLSAAEKKLGAYRGQLRIGFVECKTNKADAIKRFDENLPLQILGQPKPQQGRFYVAQNQCGEAQTDGLNTKEAGYQNGKGLRGRKVYPHHNTPQDYWQPKWVNPSIEENGKTYYQEYRRPDGAKQRNNQNRSIKGWVTPTTEFEFDIHFVNLSEVELGALLWLLKLEPNHFHRFGGGKPLGFGSVRLDLVSEKSEIQSGRELAEGRYASLDDTIKSDEEKAEFEKLRNEKVNNIIGAFHNAVASVYGGKFDEAKFVKSFLKASSGFDKPIHYPRVDREPRAEGESFEWFVANSRKSGYKLALPDIYEDEGFPLTPED